VKRSTRSSAKAYFEAYRSTLNTSELRQRRDATPRTAMPRMSFSKNRLRKKKRNNVEFIYKKNLIPDKEHRTNRGEVPCRLKVQGF